MPLGVGVVEIPYHGPCTVLREGPVVQLVPGHNPPWQPRTAVLTKDVVGFRKEGSDKIHDHVTLVDIASVEGGNSASSLLSYSVVRAQEHEEIHTPHAASVRTGTEPASSRRFMVMLFTEAESQFHGRSYAVRFNTKEDWTEWFAQLKEAVSAAKEAKTRAELGTVSRVRRAARGAFYSDACQMTFGALICTCMRANACVRACVRACVPTVAFPRAPCARAGGDACACAEN